MATVSTNLPTSTAERRGTKSIVTTKHKRWQVIKIFVIAVLTVLCISFLTGDAVMKAKDLKRQQGLKEYIQTSFKIASVIIALQDERNISTSHCIALLSRNKIGQTPLKLQNLSAVTDMRIKDLRHKWKFTFAEQNGTIIGDFSSFIKAIHRLRSQLKKEIEQVQILQHYFKVYTSWIDVFISQLVNNSPTDFDDANKLAAYEMIVKSREEFVLEKSFMCYRFVGYSSSQNNSQRILGETVLSFQNISQKRVRGEAFLEAARLLSPSINDNYLSLEHENILPNLHTEPPVNLSEWFYLMSQYCNLFIRLEANERKRISNNIKESVNKNTTLLIFHCLLVCVVLIILPLFIISLVRVQNAIYKYAHSLHQKVDLEQSRTEFLLAENSRHIEGLADRWKRFTKQPTSEDRNPPPSDTSSKECWTHKERNS